MARHRRLDGSLPHLPLEAGGDDATRLDFLPLRPRRHGPALPTLPAAAGAAMRRVRGGSPRERQWKRGKWRGSLSTNRGPPIARGGRFPQFDFCAPLTPLTLEVSRGSTASPGARQAVLLPPLRADLRIVAGARDGGDSRPRGPEVRLPELLLFADDSRRLLRRPTLRGHGGRICGGARLFLPVPCGARHFSPPLRRRAAPARGLGPPSPP